MVVCKGLSSVLTVRLFCLYHLAVMPLKSPLSGQCSQWTKWPVYPGRLNYTSLSPTQDVIIPHFFPDLVKFQPRCLGVWRRFLCRFLKLFLCVTPSSLVLSREGTIWASLNPHLPFMNPVTLLSYTWVLSCSVVCKVPPDRKLGWLYCSLWLFFLFWGSHSFMLYVL